MRSVTDIKPGDIVRYRVRGDLWNHGKVTATNHHSRFPTIEVEGHSILRRNVEPSSELEWANEIRWAEAYRQEQIRQHREALRALGAE